MREFRSYGSVRGALSNERPYRDFRSAGFGFRSAGFGICSASAWISFRKIWISFRWIWSSFMALAPAFYESPRSWRNPEEGPRRHDRFHGQWVLFGESWPQTLVQVR